MTTCTEWAQGHDVWSLWVKQHPELAYKTGRWPFYNFLRLHRDSLEKVDAIRKARGRWWIAHIDRFPATAFDCATGALKGGEHV